MKTLNPCHISSVSRAASIQWKQIYLLEEHPHLIIDRRWMIDLSGEFVKVETLQPYAKSVNIKVKVVNVGEVREVSMGERKVADALVGDETGCILMTLWDDDITKYEEGDAVQITNGYVSVFRGSMRLSAGRYGAAEKIEEEIPEVNTENNLSDREVEDRRRFDRGGYQRRGYRRRY